jgi:hypothetical protein
MSLPGCPLPLDAILLSALFTGVDLPDEGLCDMLGNFRTL